MQYKKEFETTQIPTLVDRRISNKVIFCDLCGYQANRKDYLIKHKQAKHSDITYDCDQCSYKANVRDYLYKHIRIHHKRIEFKCDQCDYSTNTLPCTHLDIVHSFQYRVT